MDNNLIIINISIIYDDKIDYANTKAITYFFDKINPIKEIFTLLKN